MSSDAEALDIDIGACRGEEWTSKCAEGLDNEELLPGLRKLVRQFKRKGGENGEPGDIDALYDDLMKILGEEDEEENRGHLKELLEGESDDAWCTLRPIYNGLEGEAERNNFMKTLNRIKCFPSDD